MGGCLMLYYGLTQLICPPGAGDSAAKALPAICSNAVFSWWGTRIESWYAKNYGSFESHLCINAIVLPRQARDKHREGTQKRLPFSHDQVEWRAGNIDHDDLRRCWLAMLSRPSAGACG